MGKHLVTGGAGFIGSHLVEALVKRGDSVVVVDNLSTGRLRNLDGIHEHVEFVQGDVCDRELMNRLTRGVECVFHQAAIPSVPRSVKDPLASNRAAVDGTLSVLLASRDAGVKRLVYASSSSVYGETEVLPKVETMPTQPISPYAVAKLTGEMYACVFWRVYGLETVSLRYFNVFGPRQDPGSTYAGVIVKFIRCLTRGEEVVIYGDGEQTRDFTPIANVVEANLRATEAGREAVGRAFNVGTGVSTSVGELLRKIAERMGKPAHARYQPARPDDIRHSLADITLARRLLGYDPRVTLDEGIAQTVEHFREEETQ